MSLPKPTPSINRKVLVVGEFGILNGGEKSFLAIASSLMELGWELSAAVPYSVESSFHSDVNQEPARVSHVPDKTEFAQALESIGIQVHDWTVRVDGKRKELSEIRNELATLINHVKPAIVHFNSLSTSRIGGPVTDDLGVPSLGYLRDIMGLSKAAIRDINLVDRIIAVSQATKDWHVARGLLPDKTFVVYNGVDSNKFSPTKNLMEAESSADTNAQSGIRRELLIPVDHRILLFVGQIGIRKGVDTLVETFLGLAKIYPDIHLLVVGQRHSQKQEAVEYEARIIDHVKASSHGSRIHLIGRRTDVADIMRASDILVHPARQEPLGRVLLEASSSGLAIVTTNVGGSAEIVCDPSNENLSSEMLVAPDDFNGLFSRLSVLLDDPEKMRKIGEALRARASSIFAVNNCVEQIHHHYELLQNLPAGN